MTDSLPDMHIQIVPLKNCDHKRVTRHKSNPLQRIKVNNTTTLFTIASYIKRLAGADSDMTTVSLHTNYHNEPLQLPLSMLVVDYLAITNQGIQGEVRYSFADVKRKAEGTAPVVHFQPEVTHQPEPNVAVATEEPPPYPPPSLGRFGPFAVGVGDVSFGSLFHSGFSLFSNSFGVFPPTIEPSGVHSGTDAKGGTSEDTISLRKNLEMEILRKT
jgi:hypothetical protein